MYTSIALPVLLSLIAATSAIPAPLHSASGSLYVRAAVAPPACVAKAKRSAFSEPGSIAKRIAQSDLGSLAQSWQDLCQASGGDITTDDPCVQLAGVKGINALLANAAPCDQQHVADAMIDFANSRGVKNREALIENARAYAGHARNALALQGGITPATPFCQEAPKNSELDGVAHAQLQGVNPGVFGGPGFAVVPFGDPVSCPRGKKPDVATCTCV